MSLNEAWKIHHGQSLPVAPSGEESPQGVEYLGRRGGLGRDRCSEGHVSMPRFLRFTSKDLDPPSAQLCGYSAS